MSGNRVVIIGANGQLGTALKELYPEAVAVDSAELDITNESAVASFDWSEVGVILNAAAYTNVDGAEAPEGRIAAWKVNASAVGHLAKVATEHDITLVHVSTDYVFDGTRSPHTEDEDFAPLSVYGASKAAGDIAAATAPQYYILRTSWVVGAGNNFVRTMHMLAGKGVQPKVVADQVGRLTFTSDLASGIKHLVDIGAPYGTYNFSNDGEAVSWADIAREVYVAAGKSADEVSDTTTEEYFAGKKGIAPRPLQSELDLTKIKSTGFTPRYWKEALTEYIQILKEDS